MLREILDPMEVVERFFELGAQVVGILLAGCRECLAEWEVQTARGRRVPSPSADILPARLDQRRGPGDGVTNLAELEPRLVCPRGQNGPGSRGTPAT